MLMAFRWLKKIAASRGLVNRKTSIRTLFIVWTPIYFIVRHSSVSALR